MEEKTKQALYRRYRSTSFDELIGQEHVTELLKSAVKNSTFSHAYLFTGQKGTGKTSAARILAYAINDLPYEAGAQHLDIIEIDAASNRRIDDIRDLREKVHIAPVSAKYKVYIIDEVHMLTGESFNALLKTLEEPPEHAVFILATTELHKVPTTIISRTQRFHFRPVALSKVVAHLNSIADKENLDITEGALRLIAEHGGGSFRDSISLLDQLSSLEGKITEEIVESILGRARSTDIDSIVALLAARDQASLHALLQEMLANGTSAVTLAEQIVSKLLSSPQKDPRWYELTEKLMSVTKAHFPQLLLTSVLLQFATEEKAGKSEKQKAEILELRESKNGTTTETPLSLKPLPSAAATSNTNIQLGTGGAETKDGASEQKDLGEKSEKRVTLGGAAPKYVSSDETILGADRAAGPANSDLRAAKGGDDGSGRADFNWENVLVAVKKTNPALHAVLSRATADFHDNELHLIFQYALHRKKLDQAQYRTQLSRAIQETCGLNPAILLEETSKHIASDDTAKKVADLMGGGESVTV